MRSSMPSCRKMMPPSSWSSTKRKARRLCLPRKSPTRGARRLNSAVDSAVLDAEAKTSLPVVADLGREVAAVEASRTEATSEEVGLMGGK